MKVLMYNIDKGGLKTYSNYLVSAMKKKGKDIISSDKLDYKNYDLVHIQFDYSLFHPFGLRIIPKLVLLKLHRKKVVLTFGVVPPKKEMYARNKLFTILKKIILPISTKTISLFCDKLIVMLDDLEKILIKDYGISKNKIKVIAHGMY